MIAEAEVRRLAARWRVDPMVVDLDYSLSWFLAAFCDASQTALRLRFKGGTCLRKCYFADYRFSEDVDFTAEAYLAPQPLRDAIERVAHWSADRDGPDFTALPARFEVVEDEYGRESYQVRIYLDDVRLDIRSTAGFRLNARYWKDTQKMGILAKMFAVPETPYLGVRFGRITRYWNLTLSSYYRGPLRWSGTPRAIRVDVTRDEQLLLPAEHRRLIHAYSDAPALGEVMLACYPLAKILAEKIRALGGQRRFAISRDLYDIHQLVQAGVTVEQVIPLLPAKFAARGIDLSADYVDRLALRRHEFEQDWRHKLAYLIASTVSFEAAWDTSIHLLRQALAR